MGGKGGLWTLGTGRINKPGELKLPESHDMEAANRPSLGTKDAELPTGEGPAQLPGGEPPLCLQKLLGW